MPLQGCRVALREQALDFDRALDRTLRAGELHQEGITDGVDLLAFKTREHRSQYLPVLLQQLNGQGFVFVHDGAVTDYVGEHDGS